MTDNEIKESLEYLRGVFPHAELYNRLVTEGAYGDERFGIDGDDLSSACWHLNELLKHFKVTDTRNRPRWVE
jgi:hypothetical protein